MVESQHDTAEPDTVRVLFGPGGFVRYTKFGENHDKASSIELTGLAADLASAGVRIPRSVCPPTDVTGQLEIELGSGGRCLWADGGGDINSTDLGWAICAALESDSAHEIIEQIAERRQQERSAEWMLFLEDALKIAGLTSKQVGGFLSRARSSLGGKSIREVVEGAEHDRLLINEALTLMHTRAMETERSEEYEMWLHKRVDRTNRSTASRRG